MIDMEPNMTPSDVEQWLNRGWFWFLPPGKTTKVIARMHHYKMGPTDHYVVSELDSGAKYSIDEPHGYVFPHWPTLGAMNIPDVLAAVHLKRVQMKQWRRTFNYRQLRITIPHKWNLQKKQPDLGCITTDSLMLVQPAFEPTYPLNQEEVRVMFDAGWVSVAMSPRIIVTNTKPRLVYFLGELAGKIDGWSYTPIDPNLTTRVHKAFQGGFYL